MARTKENRGRNKRGRRKNRGIFERGRVKVTLRLWVKLLLFVSAFTPLFLILIIKIFQKQVTGIVGGTIILIVANLIFFVLLRMSKSYKNPKIIKVAEEKEVKDAYLLYILPYIIPFLQFSYSSYIDLLCIGILILLLAFAYVNSNLIYVNPLLNIFGYNTFKVIDEHKNVYLVLSKKKSILLDSMMRVKPLSEDIFLEVEEND